MSVFAGSCCAKSLGFKSRGRKIRFASVTNGAASLRLGAWKGLCNVAERAPLQGFSLGMMGPSWPLSLFMFRVRIPIRSLIFFSEDVDYLWHEVELRVKDSTWNLALMLGSAGWLPWPWAFGDIFVFSVLGWLNSNWFFILPVWCQED